MSDTGGPSGPNPGPNPDDVIERFLASGDTSPELRRAVRAVDDVDARSRLRDVAVASTPEHSKLAFDALDALWRLGEPRDFFLRAARDHATDKWLAYQALVVLARDPADPAVRAVLDQVRSETSDGHLLSAVAMADRVRYLDEQYAAIDDDEGRIRYVLDTFRTDWNPIKATGGDVDRGTDPQAVWGQTRLRELSAVVPDACADAVAHLSPPEGVTDDYAPSYRRHIAQFLDDAARARFDEIAGGGA